MREAEVLQQWFGARQEALLEDIAALVAVDSPSHYPEGVARAMELLARRLAKVGARVTEEAVRAPYAPPLVARWGDSGPGILVLVHLDTVWPVGEVKRRPFAVRGARAYGPGIHDMKGGASLAVAALEGLMELGLSPRLPVTFLLTGDEEVGSPGSRAVIERLAADSAWVLVPEPAGPSGEVKTWRKGWGRFELVVHGRAAHAGADRAQGRSAVVEMARQILFLEAMNDEDQGTTVTVGTVAGGVAPNQVPAEARATIDLRVPDEDEARRMVAAIRGLRPVDPEVTLSVAGGLNRPPFPRQAAAELYARAVFLAGQLGLDLPETGSGGVSDGNFTAAKGVPTLDGLGTVGAGAHAEDEHIEIHRLAERAALFALLLRELPARGRR